MHLSFSQDFLLFKNLSKINIFLFLFGPLLGNQSYENEYTVHFTAQKLNIYTVPKIISN